jgi:hypothetical protein
LAEGAVAIVDRIRDAIAFSTRCNARLLFSQPFLIDGAVAVTIDENAEVSPLSGYGQEIGDPR